jgi:hypothetical protein
MWRTRLTIQAGKKGTKNLQTKYGDRFLCVRYRYNATLKKKRKTVELLDYEKDWRPLPKQVSWGLIRIACEEEELRKRIIAAGGVWDNQKRAWKLPVKNLIKLGLKRRMAQK